MPANQTASFVTLLEPYFNVLTAASPFLLGIGVFTFVLSLMFSLSSNHVGSKEIVGTYNPNLDPNRKTKAKKSHTLQLISIGVIVLGVLPWILDFFIFNPPKT